MARLIFVARTAGSATMTQITLKAAAVVPGCPSVNSRDAMDVKLG